MSDFLLDLDVLALFLWPKLMFRSLYLILKAFEPMVEKLDVRLLLAALMAVIIRIRANMPKAMMMTVMEVLNLLPLMFLQDKDKISARCIEKY